MFWIGVCFISTKEYVYYSRLTHSYHLLTGKIKQKMKLVVQTHKQSNPKVIQRSDFNAVKYVVNEVIEGKCCHWKRFYRGTVKKVNQDGTYEVHFDDGEVRRNFKPVHMHKVKFGNKERPKQKSKYSVGHSGDGKFFWFNVNTKP